MHHRTCKRNLIGFASMESRVRNFILDKAVGLLQSFKSKTLPETFGDIESGLMNTFQILPTNNRSQHCPSRERRRSIVEVLSGDETHCTRTSSPRIGTIKQGVVQQCQSTISPSNEQRANQQPRFTDGPARFVTANDGSKECIALLVTNSLITKFRDLHGDSHHLKGKKETVKHARREAREIETSINQIKETIEEAKNQRQIEELEDILQQHQHGLHNIRQQRDELENGVKQVERRVTSSRSDVEWVLHNAMKEADLLEPYRPLPTVSMTYSKRERKYQREKRDDTNREDNIVVENVTDGVDDPAQQPIRLEETDDTPEELQLIRQKAWESYNDALVTMHKVQALFDDQQQSYETDLADYQRGLANGVYDISRSDFDRSKIRYGQKLTQALINAEERFEAAKAHAQSVCAMGPDYDDVASYYDCYEESCPESQLTSYLATKDWSHIHKWVARNLELGEAEESTRNLEQPGTDDWYGDEVDPADSISQIDFDEWRKDIDRWEAVRFDRWEDMRTRVGGPEVQVGFLVRSTESLKRRHSTSLCYPELGEWERSI